MLPAEANVTDAGVPKNPSGRPVNIELSVPFHVLASTVVPTGGGGGGGGSGVIAFAMRKSAPNVALSCTVQNATICCEPMLVRVNSARTFEKSVAAAAPTPFGAALNTSR